MFEGTGSIWRLSAEGGGAGAKPKVCVCCRGLRQPGETIGEHYRSDNHATVGIHGAATAHHLGSLGTGRNVKL